MRARQRRRVYLTMAMISTLGIILYGKGKLENVSNALHYFDQ